MVTVSSRLNPFGGQAGSPIRILLAMIIGLMLTMITIVAFPSAAHSAQMHRIVKDGYTMTWTKSNFSDVMFKSTPHASDSGVSQIGDDFGSALIDKYRQVASSYSGDGSIDPLKAGEDGCTSAPAGWGNANFEPACNKHDRCDSPQSHKDRKVCDQELYSDLKAECKRVYSPWGSTGQALNQCLGAAATYHSAVRQFGPSHYHGQGKNN